MEVLRQPWKNSSGDPISKNPSQKRAGGVVQGVIPEFKLQYHKKKKKMNHRTVKVKNKCFSLSSHSTQDTSLGSVFVLF
jgi:hypothetical protein